MNTAGLRFVCFSAAMLAWSGCGGDDTDSSAAPPAEPNEPSAPAEPVLVAADAPAPSGVTFSAGETAPWVGVATPSGDDWTSERMAHGMTFQREDGVTVMLQRQNGMPASARGEYADSFVEVNERDATDYSVTERTEGLIGASPAVRVDGAFDNGTPMTTRDHLVFVNGGVSSVMVRGPATEQALVRELSDHIAASVAR